MGRGLSEPFSGVLFPSFKYLSLLLTEMLFGHFQLRRGFFVLFCFFKEEISASFVGR